MSLGEYLFWFAGHIFSFALAGKWLQLNITFYPTKYQQLFRRWVQMKKHICNTNSKHSKKTKLLIGLII